MNRLGAVKFVLIDGTEMAPSTYRFWVIVHLLLLPLLSTSIALLAAMRMRHHASLRRQSAPGEQLPALS
jgi:hypothetical protein